LKDYECAVIFAPTLAGEVLASATKRYADIISAQGGRLTAVDDWGKRSLAYEINFHREGFYCFYRFQGGHEVLAELNRQLRIDENVIRHMIVKDELKGRPIDKPAEGKPETEEAHREDAGEDV
jgi:small subunit ribosomal protein S6